jgi:ribosomal protein L12E/L44/L45/RPP1/RPP2
VYTAVLRRKVVCKFCQGGACTKCIEHYLLGRAEDAHCIHCRVNYSDTVLKDICTKTYLQQTYYKHRQAVLVSRERSQLPGLQEVALDEKQRRETAVVVDGIREEIEGLMRERVQASNALYALTVTRSEVLTRYNALTLAGASGGEINGMLQRLHALDKELPHLAVREVHIKDAIAKKRKEMDEVQRAGRRRAQRAAGAGAAEDGAAGDGADGAGEDGKEEAKGQGSQERRKFVRRCMKPNCQGYLSTAWKCGLCEEYSCGKCFTVRGPAHDTPHECKAEDIATAEMIQQGSKPCPNCGVFTERTMGCYMMWCVSCHVPWDWNTCRVVTKGTIHNPHYYEWMKRTGGAAPRNPADVPCGGFPNAYELRPVHRVASPSRAHLFFEFHRLCMELQDESERTFRSHLDQNGLRDTHVKFLLNDFDEKEWGRRLALAEKKRKRDAEIQEVYAAFRMVAVELLNRIQHYRDESVDSFTLLGLSAADSYLEHWGVEVSELLAMVNEGMAEIGRSYGCAVPYVRVEETRSLSVPDDRGRGYGRGYGHGETNVRYRLVTAKPEATGIKAKGQKAEDETQEDA